MLFKYDSAYRRRHFEIYTAIDMIKMSCVIENMIKDGSIDFEEAEALKQQARGLAKIMEIANKKGFESKTN